MMQLLEVLGLCTFVVAFLVWWFSLEDRGRPR